MRILATVLAVFLSLAAYAQGSGQSLMISPQTNEIIPPSPSSAQQMRYQSPQPALATGAVNLSIPLYSLEVEGVSIPFTMVYHTSGIKPLDDPFPFGYGWALQPALRITRTVRGRPDEHFEYYGEKISHELLQNNVDIIYACMVAEMWQTGETVTDRYDPEKDIFTISLPSGTYTRVMQRNEGGDISFLGADCDNEIVVSSSGTLEEITVTDARGIIYHFGGDFVEMPEHAPLDVKYFATSWGIKDIVLPSGRKIDFGWTYFFHTDKKIFGGDSSVDMLDNIAASVSRDALRSEAMYILPVNPKGQYKKRMHLSDVNFPGGKISIAYQDTTMSSFSVLAGNDTIRRARFFYGDGKVENKFLKKVDIDGEGVYRFDYDPQRFDEFKLWHRLDWWGYYNGKAPYDGVGNTCLTPRLELQEVPVAPGNGQPERIVPYKIGHIDRTPDENAMKAGILTKVFYPTGARSEFQYETHRFPKMRVSSEGHISEATDPWLDMGGGLRVKSVTTLSQKDDTLIHNTFSYDSVVVTAVPSAATFVSACYALGLFPSNGVPIPYDYRHTVVAHSSNYMDNHIGENDIWYSRVTEFNREGKTEYCFSCTNPPSEETRMWGALYPKSVKNVFSHGPQLTKKTVFKDLDGGYKAVETTECVYEKTGWSTIENTRISRVLLQTIDQTTAAPDFIDGDRVQYPDLVDKPLNKTYKYIWLVKPGHLVGGQNPYMVSCYTMDLSSDRLRSKTVTQHLENGDFSQTDTYEYIPGTSIVSSVVTTNPADDRVERVDLTYASPTGSEAERLMAEANMTGIPVQSKYTFGTATTTVRNEMSHYGNRVFRPSKTWLSRGSDRWLVRCCDFDAFGNIREYRGEDSIPTAYLWGYSAMHPVYRVDGASFAEISSLNPGADAVGGNAERTDIISLFGDRFVTRALWRPLVGMSSLRQPSGLTETYSYDSAGRLVRTAIEGHGPVAGYSYHINDGGLNYTTSGVYTSANSTSASVRETVNYDGLGREVSKVTPAPNPNFAGHISLLSVAAIDKDVYVRDSSYATMTVYDRMDRPYRQWATVKVASKHPTLAEVRAAANVQYGTPYAYATTYYEPSPRQLATGSMKAGKQWRDAGRRVTVRRLVNTADGDYSCYKYNINSSGNAGRRGKWETGALMIEETSDEEGHVSMVFTDRTGKTVMQREGVPGDWYDTRFLYNDYGDIVKVIQPSSVNASVSKLSCFSYGYDSRGNCISKTLPGDVTTRYWFDRRNRLVAEQDGKMAAAGRCIIYCYDRLGRLAFRAIADAGDSDLDGLRSSALTVSAPSSAVSASSMSGGYSLPDGFPLRLHALIEARYYDSYDFTSGLQGDWDNYSVPSGYAAPDRSVKGIQTGTLAGDRLTVSHFDKAGRVIRTATGPLSEAPEYTAHTAYDYVGKAVSELGVTRFADKVVEQRKRHTYHSSDHPRKTTVWQGGDTAIIDRSYDHAGRLCAMTLSDRINRTWSYNVNGWLAGSSATVEKTGSIGPIILPLSAAAPQPLITIPGQSYTSVLFSENLYYADSREGCTPRYDGKISGRYSSSRTTAYTYDNHGRLASSATVKPQISLPAFRDDADFSTAYTYDRNANIISMTRQGVTDIVDGKPVYGLHDEISMHYSYNRLTSVTADNEGADYEGRTGLPATDGSVTGFVYDANGNMTVDPVRGINRIVYNHLNQPAEITFAAGHRQTITYDGLGRKLRVDYAEGPETVLGGGFPVEQAYMVQSSRCYVGPHIFRDGELEYSAFEGGYFDPEGGTMYYLTDWQGNNAAVANSKGDRVQHTTYYPYGEPTVEPTGQRFLFGGKEREHAAGRNTYDFSARCLTPYGNWNVIDPKTDDFYSFSPYSYCGGDPINYIDPDGKQVFIVQPAVMGTAGTMMVSSASQMAMSSSNTFYARPMSPAFSRLEWHHIISKSLRGEPQIKQAIEQGFKFNGKDNLIQVEKFCRASSTGRHGNHPKYSQQIMDKFMKKLNKTQPNVNYKEALTEVAKLARQKIIENPDVKINDLELSIDLFLPDYMKPDIMKSFFEQLGFETLQTDKKDIPDEEPKEDK